MEMAFGIIQPGEQKEQTGGDRRASICPRSKSDRIIFNSAMHFSHLVPSYDGMQRSSTIAVLNAPVRWQAPEVQ